MQMEKYGVEGEFLDARTNALQLNAENEHLEDELRRSKAETLEMKKKLALAEMKQDGTVGALEARKQKDVGEKKEEEEREAKRVKKLNEDFRADMGMLQDDGGDNFLDNMSEFMKKYGI